MIKLLSVAALASAAALVVTIVLMPVSISVEAREDASAECRLVQVALDEGYSISRVEERNVCN